MARTIGYTAGVIAAVALGFILGACEAILAWRWHR